MVVRVRHYVPLSLVALGCAEALIFFGAMYLGVAVRLAGVDLSTEAASEIFPIFSKAFVFALVMLGALLAFGLYQRENQQSWLIFSDGFRIGTFSSLAKRAVDVVLASALLLLTLPVMVMTAARIWLESGRSIFYRQERVGAFGRQFKLLKFRGMRVDAEADGQARWASENDARCTGVGKVIRKLRFDGQPQLVNVLKGDMSFVGPRPERPTFVQGLSKQLGYYSFRHTAKPGITGWVQVRYPYGASMEDAKEKLQYDLYYIKNQSFLLDLIILAQTAHIVLFGKGAYSQRDVGPDVVRFVGTRQYFSDRGGESE